ncbi:hypothetical protein T484DRAFT_1612056, partial [Baffinella frigidus]
GSRVQGPGSRVQGPGFRVQGSRFKVQGSRFRFEGAGLKVQSARFRVQGSGCKVQGARFRVQGSGFKVQGPGLRDQGHQGSPQNQSVQFHEPGVRRVGGLRNGGQTHRGVLLSHLALHLRLCLVRGSVRQRSSHARRTEADGARTRTQRIRRGGGGQSVR